MGHQLLRKDWAPPIKAAEPAPPPPPPQKPNLPTASCPVQPPVAEKASGPPSKKEVLPLVPAAPVTIDNASAKAAATAEAVAAEKTEACMKSVSEEVGATTSSQDAAS